MRYQMKACCSMIVAATTLCAPAMAQVHERRQISLPEQPLAQALRQVGTIYGRNISVDHDLVAALKAIPIDGRFTVDEALDRLLAGTGLKAVQDAGGYVVLVARVVRDDTDTIVVAGSRIRGAPVASLALTYEREAMKSAGHASVADVVRTIPQNFTGGQNPGIGSNVTGGKSTDMGGGASINLRGLGSDATLTLLNGRRVSFDGALQSVDISAIPFGAIERIEIVPDGSSALFGSDAVAGVANIILRRDFEGLETSARLAGSTDGGNFQQQYGATLGQTWSSGSVLLSGEYGSNAAIHASQRSYLRDRSPGLDVYPRMRHHNAALTFRQDILPDLTFDMDGIYNKRRREQIMPLNAAGDLSVSRVDYLQKSQSWALAPSFRLGLPAGWEVMLAGSYGWNRVDYQATSTIGPRSASAGEGYYRNETANLEFSGDGRVIDLPAGPLRIAMGAGYRRDTFRRETTRGANEFVNEGRNSVYAFAEMSVPVIAPEQGSALGKRLDLSLAGRYEHYSRIGSVATPKVGLIYGLTDDLTLKGSWGKSFRAATFYEQYTPTPGFLYNAPTFGGTAGTAIYFAGGNPDLKPERSTNWSGTVSFHPKSLSGAELELSYFSIRYRNRIVTPILYTRQALTNPAYAPFVTLSPDTAAQASVIDRLVTFTNATTGAYDPARVTAIVNNSNVNAGAQNIHGVDVLGRYSFDLGEGRLSASINASYLSSRQQLLAGQGFTPLAGTLFNPPHLRGRAALAWTGKFLTATAGVTYIGSVRDSRAPQAVTVSDMAPLDFTMRYRTDADGGGLGDVLGGFVRGIDLIASIQNALNDKPDPIATSSFLDTPYDSTNNSPFGRVISLTVSKSW